jgi:hypothetical protein
VAAAPALDARILARREHQPAAAEFEVQPDVDGLAGLADQVPPGDTGVGHPIRDQLGDVLAADEDGLELTTQRCGERPFAAGADLQACVGEDASHVLGQPALVR